MRYILEVYYKGECIEHRESNEMYCRPLPGDQVLIEFENPNYSEEYGNWWVVDKVKHLLFSGAQGISTMQLFCTPDPLQGGDEDK